MQNESQYDGLIQSATNRIFPACDWILIKAQVAQESSFNPNAKSGVGAQGLMQLMPETDRSIDGDIDGFNPEGNIDNGIKYLLNQYIHLPEISDHDERLKFAFASYNAGRGYINKAIELAYACEFGIPMPSGHSGARPGKWQTWSFTGVTFLKSPKCVVNGRLPDWKQATDYVERIWARYQTYKTEVK